MKNFQTRMIAGGTGLLTADISSVGGKAWNLAWMLRQQLPVPGFFVITTAAFEDALALNNPDILLEPEGMSAAELGERCAAIRAGLEAMQPPPGLREAVRNAMANLDSDGGDYYSVRSSIVDEDGSGASFAGQMDSFLFRRGEDEILTAWLRCVASAYTERAIRYRLEKGISTERIRAAVIVQKMVDGDVSGVMFTANPVSGARHEALITSCWGSGEGVVSGACNADETVYNYRTGKTATTIAMKDRMIVFDQEQQRGVMNRPVEEARQKIPCLSPEQIHQLAEYGRKVSARKGSPQDMEWTIRDGRIHLLQTRPVTALPPADPAGLKEIIWDNSNIQESYCGITLPLSFSHANRSYGEVYRQAFRVMNVRPAALRGMDKTLNNLLGHVQGRVFYNINNWYRILLILPFFSTNKSDMERMMGLEDPVDFIPDVPPTLTDRLRRIPQLLLTLATLTWKFRGINGLVRTFNNTFRHHYNKVDRSALQRMDLSEIFDLLEEIRIALIREWDTPIVNDFYVMMMNGRVARGLKKAGFSGAEADRIQNHLMAGEEGIESTEPTKRLLSICAEIRKEPDLMQAFADGRVSADQLAVLLEAEAPVIHRQCREFIEEYGDRVPGELKLETITLRQDHRFMYSILRNFLRQPDLTREKLGEKELLTRQRAEQEAFGAMEQRRGRRAVQRFRRTLMRLRSAVKNRESMRLARTRGFGLLRDLYLEIGSQLAMQGVLDEQRDIFWLTVEEVDQYMEGRAIQTNLRPLVRARREEYAAYEDEDPGHHFATRGAVYLNNTFTYAGKEEATADAAADDRSLKGTGCYPGKVRERVRLILRPDLSADMNGQILCTVRTDPGWAPLFPSASGILVERGSTLSHSAVVARELGIPAIVGIPGLTKRLKDGDQVEMDGATGTIIPVEAP